MNLKRPTPVHISIAASKGNRQITASTVMRRWPNSDPTVAAARPGIGPRLSGTFVERKGASFECRAVVGLGVAGRVGQRDVLKVF